MVRSIEIVSLTNDDLHSKKSRSKRKKSASKTKTGSRMNMNDVQKRALYHCNYCKKDITEKVRLKCATCPDFDLCVECFSVGVKLHPHKKNHPYKVMPPENSSSPILCPDWSADEETLLLEGLEMFGLNNWAKVAEHVETKSESVCIHHYNTYYLDSPCFPLPDMSHVSSKNREELIAMAANAKKEATLIPDVGSLSIDETVKATTSTGAEEDHKKVGERTIIATDQSHISYNPKRHEFNIEYDNDAELLIADMEFDKTDTPVEHEIKLRVLQSYNRRLDERQRRKDFIIERNLHKPDPFYNDLSPEEIEMCEHFKRFMRFVSKEEYYNYLTAKIQSDRTLKKLNNLKEARDAGCNTPLEVERYLEQKRLNDEAVSSGSMDGWGVSGFPKANLLSPGDERVCVELRMMPSEYLYMVQKIAMALLKGEIKNQSEAYGLFNDVAPNKVDRIYPEVVKKLGSIDIDRIS